MRDSDQGSSELLIPASSSTSREHAVCATKYTSEMSGGPSPVNETISESAPFNLALQRQRFATMMDFLPELLALFRVNAGEHLDSIRTALSRGALPEAATAAHTLKGMSSVVCATVMQELSGELEEILKTGDRNSAFQILNDLEAQLARAIASLSSAPAP